MINEMKQIDFIKMGCHKQIAIYYGAIVTQKNEQLVLRQLIDDTNESLVKAKAKGTNSMSIEMK